MTKTTNLQIISQKSDGAYFLRNKNRSGKMKQFNFTPDLDYAPRFYKRYFT